MNFNSTLKKQIEENIQVKKKIFSMSKSISKAIDLIYETIYNGGKVYLCGNGGSAADAQHLAAEFLIRLRPKINRQPFPFLTLATDTSTLTACGNDYSFSDIFSRPFKGLADKKDLLIAISTSGNSKNIIKVLKASKEKKINSIALRGNKGGIAKKYCTLPLIVRSSNVARIQECHIFLGHFILQIVEEKLIKRK